MLAQVVKEPTFLEHLLEIWEKGGWAMWPLLLIAVLIGGFGVHILLVLRAKRSAVHEDTWREWIRRPADREGPMGALLDFVTQGDTPDDTRTLFQQVRASEVQPLDRDLRVMRIFVSAAPLVGLLGTVTGMLATFDALASGSGGDKTMSLIASGIKEALRTTETGLVIALPGLFFQSFLAQRVERYKERLAHLESVVVKDRFKRVLQVQRASVRDAAARQIAVQLARQLGRRSEPAAS